MDSVLQDFLFRNPQYYELAYPEPNGEMPAMYRRMFARFLARPPVYCSDPLSTRTYAAVSAGCRQ